MLSIFSLDAFLVGLSLDIIKAVALPLQGQNTQCLIVWDILSDCVLIYTATLIHSLCVFNMWTKLLMDNI